MTDVLTAKAVAAKLGVHEQTVRRQIRAGRFPFVPVADGGVLLPSPVQRHRISAARWNAYAAGELPEVA